MIGLDGIALINIVSNPTEAPLTKRKLLQTRITHNDGKGCYVSDTVLWTDQIRLLGGSWRPLAPPPKDSQGNPYECDSTVGTQYIYYSSKC